MSSRAIARLQAGCRNAAIGYATFVNSGSFYNRAGQASVAIPYCFIILNVPRLSSTSTK